MAQQTSISEAALPAHTEEGRSALPQWARLMGTYIGIIPLPVYVLLVAVLAGILVSGPVPTEMAMVLSIMLVGSFTLAEIGNRLPYIRNIGAAALFVTFIPSALVYYGLLPANVTKVVSDFFKSTNIMYMFIAIVIVGSILGMDRSVLIKGFVKIFVPLALGSVVGSIAGILTGMALGLGRLRDLLLCDRADHGRRRRRRRAAADDRLCRHPETAARRPAREGAAGRDGGQSHGGVPGRHPELSRPQPPEPDRVWTPAAGRARRHLRSGRHPWHDGHQGDRRGRR